MKHYFESPDKTLFITDGGLETTLVFDYGIELPHFAAFDLLNRPQYLSQITRYYEQYLNLAIAYQTGYILDTVTWRANPDWMYRLGYERDAVLSVNVKAAKLAHNLRKKYEGKTGPILVSGCLGPRRDGYIVDDKMDPASARGYHFDQIYALQQGGVDIITAMTLNYKEEALGIVDGCRMVGIPVVISFTLETDGKLPDGISLEEAISFVDNGSGAYPLFYMINCAHPTHFLKELQPGNPWKKRLRGIRANASCKSHAELNESATLDRGDREELSSHYPELARLLPSLKVVGGCCGTDISHIEAIVKSIKKK